MLSLSSRRPQLLLASVFKLRWVHRQMIGSSLTQASPQLHKRSLPVCTHFLAGARSSIPAVSHPRSTQVHLLFVCLPSFFARLVAPQCGSFPFRVGAFIVTLRFMCVCGFVCFSAFLTFGVSSKTVRRLHLHFLVFVLDWFSCCVLIHVSLWRAGPCGSNSWRVSCRSSASVVSRRLLGGSLLTSVDSSDTEGAHDPLVC